MHLLARTTVATIVAVGLITAATTGVSSAAAKTAAAQYEAIAKPMDKDFAATTAVALEKHAPRYEHELLGLPVSGKSKTDVEKLVKAIRTAITDLEAADKAGSTKATQAKVNPAAETMEADVVTVRHDLGLAPQTAGNAF
jgi:hypothetical protein